MMEKLAYNLHGALTKIHGTPLEAILVFWVLIMVLGVLKRMLSPFLWLGADGLWHCVFSVNEKDNALAHASSVDLIAWGRQSYPVFTGSQNCLLPEFKYDAKTSNILFLG
jgi:hypothetical protein